MLKLLRYIVENEIPVSLYGLDMSGITPLLAEETPGVFSYRFNNVVFSWTLVDFIEFYNDGRARITLKYGNE
jgi:hypothetical protein